jgi:hypothetical protein
VEPEWRLIAYTFDRNHDGESDLIGCDEGGDHTIERYDLSREPFPLVSLAGKRIQAFEQGTIPSPQVQLCRYGKVKWKRLR